ncbi:MAG TPA: serine/threonine-protein kinase [Polyangiaceae bacterium]|jgi:serine/threonine-protein kinase
MSDPADLVGTTIERKYAIRGVIGRGGMGMVYEAENLSLGKLVAIKVLAHQTAQNEIALERFHQEARTAGSMGHPNVCEVYDLGQLEDGRPFMVMERLVGETLRRVISRDSPLPEETVALVGAQVFAALAAAHRRGVVHRDVKPENVFLHKPGGDTFVVKVLDFGVAKAVSRSSISDTDMTSLTDSGVVLGTPYYMAPEQATGDRVGGACDVFACSIVLFEALTGRRPFEGSSHTEVVSNMLTRDPARATHYQPHIGAKLDALLVSGLARAPEERPSADTMRNELLALLPESHAMSVQMSSRSLPPPPPSTSVRLDERFRQLAAAFGSFSADFSLAQADGAISSEESLRLRTHLAELERWCRSMREDLGRAASHVEAHPTDIDELSPTIRRR